MKKILFLVISQTWLATSYAQNISADDIIIVNDLYVTEQDGAFANKLKNIGFKLKESLQDYTLNNVTYRSERSYEMVTKAPWDPRLTETGNAETFNTNIWRFQIEDHKLLIKVNISLAVYSPDSKDLFNRIYH